MKPRNRYKGPRDKDKGGGALNVGEERWVGQGKVMGENGDNYN